MKGTVTILLEDYNMLLEEQKFARKLREFQYRLSKFKIVIKHPHGREYPRCILNLNPEQFKMHLPSNSIAIRELFKLLEEFLHD
jgi:hypothetical protein